MAYTNTAAVRTYLDISGAADDDLIETLIDAAQAAIDNHCHRTFEASADSTKYFDFSAEFVDGDTLWLDDEICSITTVTNGDGVAVSSSEYTTIPRNADRFFGIRILSNSGKYWTYTDEWMDAIEVTGKWAWSTTAPDDVVQACKRLASFYYKQRDQQMFDVTAIEAGTVITPVGLPLDVRLLLVPFVKP